jgi:uncharacterized protein
VTTEKYDDQTDPFTNFKKRRGAGKPLSAKIRKRTKVDEILIEPNTGKGFVVRAGQTYKVIQSHGSQICDVIMFNQHNREERGDSCITNVFDSISVHKNSKVWSSTPYNRPIATVVEDTADYSQIPEGYVYHIWAGHCCTEWYEASYEDKNHNSCYMHFLGALLPFGMGEAEARQPNINLFQPATISNDSEGRLVYNLSPSKTKIGDYIEFFAEIDLIVVLSVCPYGDQSTSVQDAVCHPVTIEINDTDVTPKPFQKWHDWRPEFFKKLWSK